MRAGNPEINQPKININKQTIDKLKNIFRLAKQHVPLLKEKCHVLCMGKEKKYTSKIYPSPLEKECSSNIEIVLLKNLYLD